MNDIGTHSLAALLANPGVTDICVNGTGSLFFDRGRGMEAGQLDGWTEDSLRTWILQEISAAGKSWDARHPFVDARLVSGHRVHVVFPPASPNGILISLRRLPTRAAESGLSLRWQETPLLSRLVEAVRAGDSILISGATGSGKTTLAGDLLGCVSPEERIIALEDTQELAPVHPHFLSLLSRPANSDDCGEVTLRTLLRQTLRMRPDRIVLGECRGAEVLELLQALNTGHRGAMATLHAHSAREAIRRIELLCLLAGGPQLTLSAVRELLALGVQWVVQVERHEGMRRIRELTRIEGREGDTLLMRRF